MTEDKEKEADVRDVLKILAERKAIRNALANIPEGNKEEFPPGENAKKEEGQKEKVEVEK